MRKEKNDADKIAFEDMKKFKLAELWINAAVAAISALATANNIYVGIGLSAAALIDAGIQADKINSQSWVPKYAKGRKGGKEEIAIVSEEGSELVKLKSGEMFLTPDKETKMLIPEGADIIPHNQVDAELARMLSFKQISSGYQSNDTKDLNELKKEMRNMTNAVKGIKLQMPKGVTYNDMIIMNERDQKIYQSIKR
jgi:hypothetical protein